MRSAPKILHPGMIVPTPTANIAALGATDLSNPTRRGLFKTGAMTLAGLVGFPTIVTANKVTSTTPSMTEGPFWEDEKLLRSDIRSDPTTGEVEPGLPLRLLVTVSKFTNGKAKPVKNAYVDIWHCNADGYYSDEPAGMGNENTLGQKYLRGYQITNGHGVVKFVTIYPGWYGGRTVHIHARVRIYSGTTATTNFTTQFFFDDDISDLVYASVDAYKAGGQRDTTNDNDNIYNAISTGSTAANTDGDRCQLRMADDGTHVIASYNIVLA